MNTLKRIAFVSIFSLAVVFSSCAGRPLNSDSPLGSKTTGLASYYSDKLVGRKTANGEIYDNKKLTAAHLKLPFGTVVRVTNQKNRRSVQVRINDRGPWGNRGRIIDLSRAAAERLDMIRDGVVPVEVEILDLPRKK